jgi:tetratricopeptide (TPR) repeat protein
MYDKAVAELQKAVQLSGGSPTSIANLARAYVLSGNRSEAEKLLSDLKKRSNPGYSNASEIAMIYASLGDTDQAMSWLEKGYEERFNPGVLLRPGFDPLRSDSRFQNLVHRIGLPGTSHAFVTDLSPSENMTQSLVNPLRKNQAAFGERDAKK